MAHHYNISKILLSQTTRWLFALAILMLGSVQAQADDCSSFPNGVLDGDTGAIAPSQIQVDRNCTIRNFPANNPLDTNFSFLTQPGQTDQRWIVIFDNVVHTGEMACNAVAGHKIWFTNGSSTSIQEGCQNFLIPVEKIDKQVIGGQTTAAIGVPFTYRLVMPVLFDPATGVVIDTAGSLNDLHSVSVVDDLNVVGADVTYLSHTALWQGSGTPVPHSFNNNNGVLSFDGFPVVLSGEQIILDITVVLEDTPSNTPGTQFTNIAKWDFGRLIDGEFFEPLPGEWGISPTLTIAGPELVVTKTGPATLNLGEAGDFTLDIQNTGNGDAWDITLVDRLPDGPNGGMCDIAPVIVSAQVFASDGTTAVPGKGSLVEGVDYTLQWDDAPGCELTLILLTQQAVIGAGERLIINYQSQLNTDTDNGVSLTNVAGATEYFNGDNSSGDRLAFSRPVNNGTVGTPDHQDAHTVTTALTGFYYEKTVQNLNSGVNPADTAAPGDTLRYTLRLRTTDTPLTDVRFYDDLGELNTAVVFESGTLTFAPGSTPPGANNNSNLNGGTNGAGIVDISGINLGVDDEVTIDFDVTLAAAILDGAVVTNQADLLDVSAVKLADSDDPNVNGIASPDIDGDEDPTQVVIEAVQPDPLLKENTQTTAAIGEQFSYQITVPSTPHTAPLYDVQILDDLAASAADLQFISVSKVSAGGSWTPQNTGTATNLVIEDPVNGIDIPVGEQAVIEITVVLLDTGTNVPGLTFSNTAAYTYNQLDDDPLTVRPGDPGTTAPMTIVGSELTLEKSGPLNMALNLAGTFTLDIQNIGDATAYNLALTDLLPDTATGGMCDAAPTQITAQLFESDGITAVAPALVAGADYAVNFSQPDCRLTYQSLTPAAAVGPGQHLIISYEASLDVDTQADASLTNIAAVTEWFSADVSSPNPDARQYTRPLTDGTVGVLDHEDAHTVTELTPQPDPLLKENTQTTAAIGEQFSYQITVPSTPHTAPLYDVQILDDLAASAADLQFVSVSKVSAGGSWTPQNTGTATNLVIEDPVNGIDIPADEQVIIEITVVLLDTGINVPGLTFSNTAAYTYNQLDNNPATVRPGEPGTTALMTIAVPELTLEKNGPLSLRLNEAGSFTLDIQNIGAATAYNLALTDLLPDTATGGMCDAPPANINVQLLESDGVTPVVPAPAAGTDYVINFSQPDCRLTLQALTPLAAVAPGQHLVISYEASLDADTQQDAALTNIAAVTEWFSADVSSPNPDARQFTRLLTDGTVGLLDHEDAHTLVEFTPELLFEKTVVNVTTGQDPALVAAPGDTLRYSLRVENVSNSSVSNFSITDELGRLNAVATFQPGTLIVDTATLPPGAVSNSDPNGGASGTGLLDIQNLNIGGLGATVLIEFEVTLAPVLANGSYVVNQSEAVYSGFPIAISDDPGVNGQADPNITGDEDPTRVLIQSAPEFLVEKISTDITGDPNVLVAGETLRYTITVQNNGTDNATSVQLVDQLPVNTTYVSGSTTLNGAAVPDAAGGALPLIDGLLINAPEDPAPGVLNTGVANNIASISFDVVIDNNVADGTIISNQAFVSTPDASVFNVPSDDPNTATAADPTLDVVGNVPLLFAEKSATLLPGSDGMTLGIVDPGDTLLYTITVYNYGNIPATLVELTDALPADTTYVANTTTLNSILVGQPDDGGVFSLAGGLAISSSDLTPPLPLAGEGTISPGESATVQFELLVIDDGSVLPGTLITNQAVVASNELSNLLTDGDGNPATGPEPTIVVVGDVQQLTVSKQVTVVGGGAAEAGSTLEYLVIATNIGAVPAFNVAIYDGLDLPVAGQLTYVGGSATLNGLSDGIGVNGTQLLADYFATYGPLPSGESAELRFRAVVDPGLPIGTTVTNIAEARWNNPLQSVTASVSVDLGGIPGAGTLNGTAWHDANFNNSIDAGERLLGGWTVDFYRNGQRIVTTLTDASGNYSISAVVPNYLSNDPYEIRFVAPGAGLSTAPLGLADSEFTDGLQYIADILVTSGDNLLGLNLPIDPNGVVYNSVARSPMAGAVVTLLADNNGAQLPDACLDDPRQQNQVTLVDGYYKFDLNFSDPACPSGGSYMVQVTPPAGNFVPGPSQIIPSADDPLTGPLSVPACPGSADDAIGATLNFCEIQISEFAPPTSIAARSAGTRYFTYLTLDGTQTPGSSQLFNNHIPVDPELSGSVAISKTTPSVNVTRGQLVPYTITVNNSLGINLTDANIVDRYPAGFRYIEGSARVDGVADEPVINGRELVWSNLTLLASGQHELKLLLAVGAGVSEGEFINRAQVMNGVTGNAMSEEAMATVRLVPDPTFDCTDVTGKVYDDSNRNGYQDEGEEGLGGVRLVTTRGLAAKTDAYGRFHITCAIAPNENRGSNFVLKIDDRTLPSGYRASTREVQIKRATRGKALNFDFGASIHRVVAMDLADPVFEPGSTELRAMWQPRLGLLVEELQKSPAVLRLSYLADVEDPNLVDRRVKRIKAQISEMWTELNCCYELVIEPEVHWRLGGPPPQPKTDGRLAQ
jgi:uncharacterized repeat protein (TIGR01451 family)/fimbrial isopeptide formation D2 family protein